MNKTNIPEMSVGDLANKLKKIVEDNFGYVKIKGEISGYRGPHTSGHCYFALKDSTARLEAIIWRGQSTKLKHHLKEGLEVVAMGKITTYPGSSKYQIIIEQLEPAGAGALMALLEERRKKLQKEGLFDEKHKKPLPFLPKVIALITSPTGAVLHDIKHRIDERFPLHILLWPARMQGETCGDEVANAIENLNSIKHNSNIPTPDLIIVARGGGSLEDLWGFNDEKIVRAAFKSQIPIISAVGHETDWTLLDYVADKRAPTPTGAAEIATPIKESLELEIADYSKRHKLAIKRLLEQSRTKAQAATRGLASPDTFLAIPRRRFDESATRLTREFKTIFQKYQEKINAIKLSPLAVQQTINLYKEQIKNLLQNFKLLLNNNYKNKKQKLHHLQQLLNTLSYKNILERGFAVVRDKNLQPLTSAEIIKQNNLLNIEMHDGTVKAEITDDKQKKLF